MNIQIDVRVMVHGYQEFQFALINGSYGFVGRLGRLESPRLYGSGSKYVELGT